MSFPVFIPMMSGGGGPSSKKEVVVLLSIYSGILYGVGVWFWKPSYQMKVNQHGTVAVRRTKGFTNGIRVENKNVDCLHKKGYSVVSKNIYGAPSIYSEWTPMMYVEGGTSDINQYLADCKACNVYTEIRYTWDDILKNEHTGSQQLYWHKCYKPAME